MEDISSVKSSEIKPKNKNDYKCAPSQQFSDGSCMSVEILCELAKIYNESESKKPIKLSPKLETLNPKKYKRYLVREFSKRLGDVCDNQKCWVKQNFTKRLNKKIREELDKYTFRPEGPEGKFTWLNTVNINEVMLQYEKKYSDFKFMGAVPMDFDDLPELGIKNANWDTFKKNGKSKLGFVFNLDEHYKSGSHWVGMYTDLDKGQIYFFDSYAIQPEKRVRVLMRRIEKYMEEKGIKTDVNHNKTRYQYKNSECGVYSMHFILRMLEGTTFNDILKKPIKDEEINKYRDIYFTLK